MGTSETLVEDEKCCAVRWTVRDFLKRTQNRNLLSDQFFCKHAPFRIGISSTFGKKKKKAVIITSSPTSVQHSWKVIVEGRDGTILAEFKDLLEMHKRSFTVLLQNIMSYIHPDGSLVLLFELRRIPEEIADLRSIPEETSDLHSIPEEIDETFFPPLQNPGYRKKFGKVVNILYAMMLYLTSIGDFLAKMLYQLVLFLARSLKFAYSHILLFRSSEDYSETYTSQRRQQYLAHMEDCPANDKRTDVLARDFGKLLSSGEASDVNVRVNGQREFHVHKAILIARTPVFGSMFRHQMSETETGIVDIEDCDPDTFQRFLRFIYTGSVEDLRPEDAIQLYRVADKYQVDELKSLCRECISEGLSVQSFCSTISLAVQHGENELTERAIELFTNNVDDIVLTVQWQEFLSENPIQGNELFVKALRKRNARLEEKHDNGATNAPPSEGPRV